MRGVAFWLIAAITVFGGWLLWLVGSPPHTSDPAGDAILVHAGGQGERLQVALELLGAGVAPVMVVSDPEPGSVPNGLCTDVAVVCVKPEPADTSGEARSFADVAEISEWNTVVVVTSDYHLRRATMLDRSCTSATVIPVAASSQRARRPISDVEVQETFALVLSWLFQRCG